MKGPLSTHGRRGIWITMAAGVGILAIGLTGDAFAGGAQCPADGENKVDVSGGTSFTCPEGGVIIGVCVKAGDSVYGTGDTGGEQLDPGPAGCYGFGGVGTPTGTTSGGGTGRDCKEISHSSFYCGPGPTPTPACPNRSYALRFPASESTSYASCTSEKRVAASADLFTSGWNSRASRRYALRMASAPAARSTPSTS